MNLQTGLFFEASDGKKIAYRKFTPPFKAAAIVIIGHGMNEHGRRYHHLGQAFSELGCIVCIPDHRGHGDTDKAENRGFLAEQDGFARVVKDIVELGEFASREAGGLPLYYFGHSFGALVGLALCGMHGERFAGMMLSAPPEKPSPALDLGGSMVVSLGKTFKGHRSPGHLPKAMTFGAFAKTVPDARTGSDWISRDTEMVDAYVADPDCNFTCSYGFYADLMQGVRLVYSKGFLERVPQGLPLLLLAGSDDPVVGMRTGFERVVARIEALRLKDFSSICYEGGRHESHNELNRDEVLGNLSVWLARRLHKAQG